MNEMARKKESTRGENLAKQIIEQYKPKSVADMQDALKDIFGSMFEAMLQGEMNNHLGYESNDHGIKTTDNWRNGYTNKKVKTSAGEVDIKVPRDRDSSFKTQLTPKRQKDVSEIEEKVLAMYAIGMSQRDIAETIEDIYGFEISHEWYLKLPTAYWMNLTIGKTGLWKGCTHFCLWIVCMLQSEKSMRAKIMQYIRF